MVSSHPAERFWNGEGHKRSHAGLQNMSEHATTERQTLCMAMSQDAVGALANAALPVQAAFREVGAATALQGLLLRLGPDHPTAGAAAKALLVLLYDFHRAPAWL